MTYHKLKTVTLSEEKNIIYSVHVHTLEKVAHLIKIQR